MSTTSPAPARPGPPHPGVDRDAVWRYLRALGASRPEADDLAQETMLVACRLELPGGDERRAAFLRGIARNLWLRTRRFWRRRREREIAAAVEQLWVDTAAHDGGDERIDRLRHCLDELQPRARHALELHYREGLDWRSVAARVGMKPNGTKTLAQRARQALRACIERRNA